MTLEATETRIQEGAKREGRTFSNAYGKYAVWVGNVPEFLTREALEDLFADFAFVSAFVVWKHKCAFVNFDDMEECEKAIAALHDTEYMGRRLVVRLRNERKKSPGSSPPPPGETEGAYEGNGTNGIVKGRNLPANGSNIVANANNVAYYGNGETKRYQEKPFYNRFFLLKSSNQEDLDIAAETGVWATESSIDFELNRAFLQSENVYLIFASQKTKEFFGVARMATQSGVNVTSSDWINASRKVCEILKEREVQNKKNEKAAEGKENKENNEEKEEKEEKENKEEKEKEAKETKENSPSEERDEKEDKKAGAGADLTPEERVKTWGKCFGLHWISLKNIPFAVTRHLRNPWSENKEVRMCRDGTELESNLGLALFSLFVEGVLGYFQGYGNPTSTTPLTTATATTPNPAAVNPYLVLDPSMIDSSFQNGSAAHPLYHPHSHHHLQQQQPMFSQNGQPIYPPNMIHPAPEYFDSEAGLVYYSPLNTTPPTTGYPLGAYPPAAYPPYSSTYPVPVPNPSSTSNTSASASSPPVTSNSTSTLAPNTPNSNPNSTSSNSTTTHSSSNSPPVGGASPASSPLKQPNGVNSYHGSNGTAYNYAPYNYAPYNGYAPYPPGYVPTTMINPGMVSPPIPLTTTTAPNTTQNLKASSKPFVTTNKNKEQDSKENKENKEEGNLAEKENTSEKGVPTVVPLPNGGVQAAPYYYYYPGAGAPAGGNYQGQMPYAMKPYYQQPYYQNPYYPNNMGNYYGRVRYGQPTPPVYYNSHLTNAYVGQPGVTPVVVSPPVPQMQNMNLNDQNDQRKTPSRNNSTGMSNGNPSSPLPSSNQNSTENNQNGNHKKSGKPMDPPAAANPSYSQFQNKKKEFVAS